MSAFLFNVARRGAGLSPLGGADRPRHAAPVPVATPLPQSYAPASDGPATDVAIDVFETTRPAPRPANPQLQHETPAPSPMVPPGAAAVASVAPDHAAAPLHPPRAAPAPSLPVRFEPAPALTEAMPATIPRAGDEPARAQPVITTLEQRTVVERISDASGPHVTAKAPAAHERLQEVIVRDVSSSSLAVPTTPMVQPAATAADPPAVHQHVTMRAAAVDQTADADVPTRAALAVANAPPFVAPRRTLPADFARVPVDALREPHRQVIVEIGALEIGPAAPAAPVEARAPAVPRAMLASAGFDAFAALRRYERVLL